MKEIIEDRVVESSGGLREKRFGMNVGAKAFRTVIKNLYSKVESSSCRELGSNAFDSHIKAGKPGVPFDVHLPTKIDPTFSVRDYGVGLSIEDVENVYTVMFASTKDQSNDEVGKFGLGAKIPFAYCDTFGLTCWKDGRKTVWSMIIGADGEPLATLLVDEASDEPSGVEVSFPVDEKDWTAFEEGAARAFAAFPVTPNISNVRVQQAIVKFKSAKRIVKCGEVYPLSVFREVFPRSNDYLWARQGCVVYPIRQESMSQDMTILYSILQSQQSVMIVNVPIGDVEITPNREEIIYDARTVANLAHALTEGGSVLTADALSLFAKAKIKSRFNWIDLFEARKRDISPKVISNNVGDPYPHIKIFGSPVSVWRECAISWRQKYLVRMTKRGCHVSGVSLSKGGIRNPEASLEDIASVVRINQYSVSGHDAGPLRRYNTYDERAIRLSRCGRKRAYHGRSSNTVEPKATLFVLIPANDENSPRDVAAHVIQRMTLSGMKHDNFILMRGGTIKDVAALWHFSGRPHITPEVIDLSLGVQKIVVSRMKSIVISDGYNSSSQPVEKIISSKAKVIALPRDEDGPLIFGKHISIQPYHEHIGSMCKVMGIEKYVVAILPFSKIEMAKETIGDNLIMIDDFIVDFLKSLSADEVDIARAMNPYSSNLVHLNGTFSQSELKEFGCSEDRLRRLRKVCSVSFLLKDRSSALDDIMSATSVRKTVEFARGKEVKRIKLLDDKWEAISALLGERSRRVWRPEGILAASASVAGIKKGTYALYKKEVNRLQKGNCERLGIFKRMMLVRKTLHKGNPIIAAMLENGCSVYTHNEIAGTYNPREMIKSEVERILAKARLWE